jgi:hypothetical protein
MNPDRLKMPTLISHSRKSTIPAANITLHLLNGSWTADLTAVNTFVTMLTK